MSSLLAPGSEKEGFSYFSEDHVDRRDNRLLQGQKYCMRVFKDYIYTSVKENPKLFKVQLWDCN